MELTFCEADGATRPSDPTNGKRIRLFWYKTLINVGSIHTVLSKILGEDISVRLFNSLPKLINCGVSIVTLCAKGWLKKLRG